MKIIDRLKSFIDAINTQDPIKHCTLYKKEGCSFVDGPLCDYPYCQMNKKFISDIFKNLGIKYGKSNNTCIKPTTV